MSRITQWPMSMKLGQNGIITEITIGVRCPHCNITLRVGDTILCPHEPPIAGTADTEWESRLDAERVTLELKQKSTRRVDSGKEPITDAPLFGGPAQGGLF